MGNSIINEMRRFTVILIAAAAVLAACEANGDQPTPTAIPAFTQEELVTILRTEIEAMPAYDKIVVADDVVAWFAPCDSNPPDDYPEPWFYHLPSASWAGRVRKLPFEGESKYYSAMFQYRSDEGERRLKEIVADTALVEYLRELGKPSVRCPARPA